MLAVFVFVIAICTYTTRLHLTGSELSVLTSGAALMYTQITAGYQKEGEAVGVEGVGGGTHSTALRKKWKGPIRISTGCDQNNRS